jgi:hypothetical protein
VTVPKPAPKVNQHHQVILASFLNDHLLAQPRLARNVSWSSVEIAAKRWMP